MSNEPPRRRAKSFDFLRHSADTATCNYGKLYGAVSVWFDFIYQQQQYRSSGGERSGEGSTASGRSLSSVPNRQVSGRAGDHSHALMLPPSVDRYFAPVPLLRILNMPLHAHGIKIMKLMSQMQTRSQAVAKIADRTASQQTTVWVKKIPPRGPDFFIFFHKRLRIFNRFLHTYYTFLSTLDYKFLFKYLRFWRSYAILSATTQFT